MEVDSLARVAGGKLRLGSWSNGAQNALELADVELDVCP